MIPVDLDEGPEIGSEVFLATDTDGSKPFTVLVNHPEHKKSEISHVPDAYRSWWLVADWKFLRRKADLFG